MATKKLTKKKVHGIVKGIKYFIEHNTIRTNPEVLELNHKLYMENADSDAKDAYDFCYKNCDDISEKKWPESLTRSIKLLFNIIERNKVYTEERISFANPEYIAAIIAHLNNITPLNNGGFFLSDLTISGAEKNFDSCYSACINPYGYYAAKGIFLLIDIYTDTIDFVINKDLHMIYNLLGNISEPYKLAEEIECYTNKDGITQIKYNNHNFSILTFSTKVYKGYNIDYLGNITPDYYPYNNLYTRICSDDDDLGCNLDFVFSHDSKNFSEKEINQIHNIVIKAFTDAEISLIIDDSDDKHDKIVYDIEFASNVRHKLDAILF